MSAQPLASARRIARAVIADPICIPEAIDDLLTAGMDPALLLSALDSLNDIAESPRTRRQAKAAATSMRREEARRDVIYAEADADYTDADRNSGIHRVGIDD